jgi:perosamine synthetase|tara:strand:+ start:4683 stop:5843 length:1161 start_codon:yes stop_codon:yes gene_type:complete
MQLYKNLYKKINYIVKKKTGLHEPKFDKNDIKIVSSCIKSSFVSTFGKFVVKFEKSIKKITNSKYVIATNTGTSALHIALMLVGVKKDTNVLLPTLSFAATGNAVLYNNAIPIFLDSSESTFCLDEEKLEKYLKLNTFFINGKRCSKHNKKLISAIIVTHVFGSYCDMEKILKISKKYGVPIVEDCAEGLGSLYKKKHLGTFGNVGILSFNGNKIVTSGSGGAIITNSKKLYLQALHLVSVSKIKHKWKFFHDKLGWNYRMSSLSASLGYSQLKKIRSLISKKKILHNKYKKQFENDKNFHLMNLERNTNFKSNYWLNALRIDNKKISKKKTLDYLNDNGIQCRPIWDLLHTLPHFKKFKHHDINGSKKLFDRIILLPSSPSLIKN